MKFVISKCVYAMKSISRVFNGVLFASLFCVVIGCVSDKDCPNELSCVSTECQDPCIFANPCDPQKDCQVQNHKPFCITGREPQPNLPPTCDQCPPGVPCNPATGACGRAPTPKRPQPCQLDTDCWETEACYNGQCEDLCSFTNLCAPTAKCHVVKHRPVCTCPSGYQGNPAINCYLPKTLTCYTDLDCSINEVCLQGVCQLPCSAHNPCAQNAVCVNTNHGPDCSCIEGYQGNGFVGCIPVESYKPICQYNEDCPPDKLCDRLNRICINPCFEDSCGENAECVPKNHKIDCRCPPGSHGNPYLSCSSVTGCRRDEDCASNEACIEGKCGNPCRCGPNAVCDVIYHRASCKCLPGYSGNPAVGCRTPQNPCEPNPCGMHALCELDNGNPVCFCPKGMTGNPFKQCIPEGEDCTPNPCGPHSGCKVVHGSAVCFCLPEFEGDPPITPCHLPKNPCQPSPCGPNTQCTLTDKGYAKCTCLEGYVESQNTIRGCVEKRNPCEPNPCGYGAICDPNRQPSCFCPESTVGNPYKYCGEPVKTLCQPGPCGHNSDCYVTGNTEQCFCKPGFQGDPYTACHPIPNNPCSPNPCGPYATCTVSHDGQPQCTCPPGVVLDSNGGCTGYECTVDEDCPFNKACVAYKCQDPCPGSCGIGASCRVEKHHPVCTCNHGLTGNPLIRCFVIEAVPETNPCSPYPCGPNTYCKIAGKRAVCTCVENFVGDPKKGCKPECVLNTDCSSDKVCINYQCKDPCGIKNVCGLGAVCLCRDHMPTCICREGFAGNPFIQCTPKPSYPTYPNTTLPCAPSPCDPHSACHVYGGQVAMCDPCSGPNGHYNPACHPECLYNADCPFNLACLSQKCQDPCPGSCGINAHCMVVKHTPVCSCPESLTGNPYEHCSPIKTPIAPSDHCHRDRCGANAICKNNHGHVTCECIRGYFGNPYLAWAPHEYGLVLACGSLDGTISIISYTPETNSWEAKRIMNAHTSGCNAVSWCPASALISSLNPSANKTQQIKRLASGGCDNLVKIWKEENDQWVEETKIEVHADWVRDVAWAPSVGLTKNLIASCSQDHRVVVSSSDDFINWKSVVLHTFDDAVWSVSWSLTANILAVSGADNKVSLWKTDTEGQWVCISEVIKGQGEITN